MKPKVAFFDMASCEGCQLALLNCEEIFLNILDLVDIVEFREAMSEKSQWIDIAFVEGSIHREMDADRVHLIRARSRLVVSLGACACNGNVQARSNLYSPTQNFHEIYGEDSCNRVQTDQNYWPLWAHTRVRPLHEVIKVDYQLRGCPMVKEEFLHLIKRLIVGSLPRFEAKPVCSECKRNGNECVYERGETCMGQITWAGCNAVCISSGYRCDGCRGLLPQANLESHRQLLKDKGLTDETINNRYNLFCNHDFQNV